MIVTRTTRFYAVYLLESNSAVRNGTTSFKDASSTRQPIPIGNSLLRLSTAFLFVVPATVSRAILYCNTIFVGATLD